MDQYVQDNIERVGNYLSIEVMKSSVCNANECCYITQVVLSEIGKVNIVCEGCVLIETHDVDTFILESLCHMLTSRNKSFDLYFNSSNM